MATVPGTITCALCGHPIPVRLQRVSREQDRKVLLLVVTTPLVEHYRACPGVPAPALPPTQLPEGVVAKGRRPCLGCGTVNADCMASLADTGTPCCGVCGETDTHPSPGTSLPCAVWAQEHDAPQD